MTSRHDDRIEPIEITGGASEDERRAIAAALEGLVTIDRRGEAASLWRRAGRAQGRRLGMTDYRDRFSRDDAWRMSARFGFGGREYPGLIGRGDAK